MEKRIRQKVVADLNKMLGLVIGEVYFQYESFPGSMRKTYYQIHEFYQGMVKAELVGRDWEGKFEPSIFQASGGSVIFTKEAFAKRFKQDDSCKLVKLLLL